MNKKKRFKPILIAAIVLLLIFSLFVSKSKDFVFWLVAHGQDDLTAMANTILASQEEKNDQFYYFYDIRYRESIDTVRFTTSYWGIAPSSVSKGFYYSPENTPLGCDYGGNIMSFTPYESGWLWEEENGNNTLYTEKIADHWFWFEERT